MPMAIPPSQMKTASPSAQRKDVVPWEKAGRRMGCIGPKKFTEPVALSSPEPVGFPLARTAPGPSFDLLALRSRCKQDTTTRVGPVQGGQRKKVCSLHTFHYWHAERAIRAACSR